MIRIAKIRVEVVDFVSTVNYNRTFVIHEICKNKARHGFSNDLRFGVPQCIDFSSGWVSPILFKYAKGVIVNLSRLKTALNESQRQRKIYFSSDLRPGKIFRDCDYVYEKLFGFQTFQLALGPGRLSGPIYKYFLFILIEETSPIFTKDGRVCYKFSSPINANHKALDSEKDLPF